MWEWYKTEHRPVLDVDFLAESSTTHVLVKRTVNVLLDYSHYFVVISFKSPQLLRASGYTKAAALKAWNAKRMLTHLVMGGPCEHVDMCLCMSWCEQLSISEYDYRQKFRQSIQLVGLDPTERYTYTKRDQLSTLPQRIRVCGIVRLCKDIKPPRLSNQSLHRDHIAE